MCLFFFFVFHIRKLRKAPFTISDTQLDITVMNYTSAKIINSYKQQLNTPGKFKTPQISITLNSAALIKVHKAKSIQEILTYRYSIQNNNNVRGLRVYFTFKVSFFACIKMALQTGITEICKNYNNV